jgi:hypothetical protein
VRLRHENHAARTAAEEARLAVEQMTYFELYLEEMTQCHPYLDWQCEATFQCEVCEQEYAVDDYEVDKDDPMLCRKHRPKASR